MCAQGWAEEDGRIMLKLEQWQPWLDDGHLLWTHRAAAAAECVDALVAASTNSQPAFLATQARFRRSCSPGELTTCVSGHVRSTATSRCLSPQPTARRETAPLCDRPAHGRNFPLPQPLRPGGLTTKKSREILIHSKNSDFCS